MDLAQNIAGSFQGEGNLAFLMPVAAILVADFTYIVGRGRGDPDYSIMRDAGCLSARSLCMGAFDANLARAERGLPGKYFGEWDLPPNMDVEEVGCGNPECCDIR